MIGRQPLRVAPGRRRTDRIVLPRYGDLPPYPDLERWDRFRAMAGFLPGTTGDPAQVTAADVLPCDCVRCGCEVLTSLRVCPACRTGLHSGRPYQIPPHVSIRAAYAFGDWPPPAALERAA